MGRFPWVVGGLAAAGIIHILCILSIPQLARQDAWARLSAAAKPNAVFIPGPASHAGLPFTASDVLTAYCLFDLTENNLVVKAPLLEPFWSLAVSTRGGENFYLVTGADAKRPGARLLLIPQERLAVEASTEKTDEGDEQTIVVSPERFGIVAIRAPLRGESFRDRTAEELQKKVRCEAQKPNEPVIASVTETPAAPLHGNDPANRLGKRGRR